jgi:hypothetical protein
LSAQYTAAASNFAPLQSGCPEYDAAEATVYEASGALIDQAEVLISSAPLQLRV